MKKQLLSLLLVGTLFTGANAQTLLYSNDFESGLNGSTIVGNGIIEASGNPAHGQVFHNDPALTNQVRSNYLLLPNTIFSDFQTNGALGFTISFWVNKGSATNFYWSPIFGAYKAAPNPDNSNNKPEFTLMARKAGLINFDYNNGIDGINYGWAEFNDNISTNWLDDAAWHFYTFTVTPTTGKVYIDGIMQNSCTFNENVNGFFTVASELKYICLGGNQAWGWNDPDPAFLFDKLNIYAGALTSTQINSLMTTDQLNAPVLTVNTNAVYIDDFQSTTTVTVSGANLSDDIIITPPAGITVSPSTISRTNASDVNVSISFDGESIIDGTINVASGNLSQNIAIKTSTNAGCYEPNFDIVNLIADPTFSESSLLLGGFGGWGPTGINVKTPFCGRGSAYVRGSCYPSGGSIDRTLSVEKGNELKPNTSYRLRAMVNSQATPDTYFQFQIEGYSGTESKTFLIGNTNGWKQIDTTFTTGATVTVDKGIYFNSCTNATPALTDTAFIDNYELYEIPTNSGIKPQYQDKQLVYLQGNDIVSEFELSKQSIVTTLVFDLQGKVVLKSCDNLPAGKNKRYIKNPLLPGVYFVRLSCNEFLITRKLIVK